MKKIILKTLSVIGITIILLVTYLAFNINKEDLNFKSKYEIAKTTDVKDKIKSSENFYVIILSSNCPGKYQTTGPMKKNIEFLKSNGIPFILVADELYSKDLDEDLDRFKKEFNFNEKIYIMDKNKYVVNGGLFNTKKRYNDFLNELVGENHNIPLGYGVYLKFKDNKFISHNNKIEL